MHNHLNFVMQLTVTSLTPAIFAPRHKPVDIAPQPEYKSNNEASPNLLSVSTTLFVSSLEIVDEASSLTFVLSSMI